LPDISMSNANEIFIAANEKLGDDHMINSYDELLGVTTVATALRGVIEKLEIGDCSVSDDGDAMVISVPRETGAPWESRIEG
jgi:hypothetical protein